MRKGIRPLDDDKETFMPLSLTDGRTLQPVSQKVSRVAPTEKT